MKFELTVEQTLIAGALRDYLSDAMPLERIRRIAADRKGFDPSLWAGIRDLGVPGLVIDERFGGTGLGMLDAAVVAEQLGYAAAPLPFAATGVMAPIAIAAAGSIAQQQAWLPRIAAGEMRVAVGAGVLSGSVSSSRLRHSGDYWSGRSGMLLDSAGATHALLFGADGRAGLVEIDSPGVELVQHPTLDRTRPLAEMVLHNVAMTPLVCTDAPLGLAHRVIDAGRVMLAADILGAGQRMIEKSVEYAGQRVQFDRVIASFQAVKHMCAEMVVALEPARALVWYSAWIQDRGDDAERAVHANLAKAHLAEVGRDVSRTATEVHGGMGFTDLMGLHYWFKRIAFDRQALGSPERCREDAARAQGFLHTANTVATRAA